jgi:hypothetical protein
MRSILEVNAVPEPSIVPIRQPRLLLPNRYAAWPEEAWDDLHAEVQREVLRQLARLLTRWLSAKQERR